MLVHALLPISNFGKCPVGKRPAATRRDFRNMFPKERNLPHFKGFESEERTRKMLERLAVRITKEGENTIAGDNTGIPAGYTYLAQMVSHDIVRSVAEGPDVTESTETTHNTRVDRLILDTIYGRGPASSPSAYALSRGPGQHRTRLRLGKCRWDGARPAGGPALDIPRIGCPEIDNLPDRGATEALLADPRNDVSLIMSQLTVVFHLLHNRIETEIARLDKLSDPPDDQRPDRRFARARKATAFVFRHIVPHDLMKRLLCQSAYARLGDALTSGAFRDPVDDTRMPVEFSDAAYRVGHSMVRSTYAVNDDRPFTGIKDIVRFTSSRRPYDMPLSSDWLVQWARFFETTTKPPNFSRLILPAVAPALGVNDLFATQDDEYGGLILRDLLRGAESDPLAVTALIDKLDPDERASDFLADAKARAACIKTWLESGDSAEDGDGGLDDEDIEKISNDPPLLFFILMEAKEVEAGARLGPVGSMVVGESVYGALYRTRSMIEGDTETTALMDQLFAGGMPESMPALISHLESTGDLPSA